MRSEIRTVEMSRHAAERVEKLVAQPEKNPASEAVQVLPPGQWMRKVLGFEAPFGHDNLPTVWG